MGLVQKGTSPNNSRADAARMFDPRNIMREPNLWIPKADVNGKAHGCGHRCQGGKARVVGDGPGPRQYRCSDPSASAKLFFSVFELPRLDFHFTCAARSQRTSLNTMILGSHDHNVQSGLLRKPRACAFDQGPQRVTARDMTTC